MDHEAVERIMRTIAPLAALYPNWKPEEATYEVYAQVLADLDPDMLEQAIAFLLNEPREFMALPAHIRQAAFRLEDLQSDYPDAYTAWAQVTEHFHSNAPIHPFAREVADLIGGLRAIGQSDNPVAERARFIDAFNAANERRQREQRMLPATRNFILGLDYEDTPELVAP